MLKPSEVAAATSGALAQLIPEYLDPDAIAVVEGAVSETKALLAERFDHIFYTGNGRVGRVVMEAASRHLTPVTLELGGKSPAIVDGSANLEVAARRIAWGKFLNAGQTCIAPDYVLVSRDAARPARRAHPPRRLRLLRQRPEGEPRLRAHRQRQPFQAPRRSSSTREPPSSGASRDAATRYIAPTVLRDVAADAPVMQEEIFGPVLPVLPVDDVDEAIAFVNAHDKPLALYVFAGDKAVANRVVEQHEQRRRVRQRDALPRRGPQPAVRRRRRERCRRLPRQGELRRLQSLEAGAQEVDASRPRPRVPAVHRQEGAARAPLPVTEPHVVARRPGRRAPSRRLGQHLCT